MIAWYDLTYLVVRQFGRAALQAWNAALRSERRILLIKKWHSRECCVFCNCTSLSVVRYNEPTVRNKRASYNGSIEASQASDVGSIPIARSNKINYLQTFHAATAAPFGSNWNCFWTCSTGISPV